MKLPSFKRIISSDFAKEFQKLIDQLSLSLNGGIDSLFNALQNNINLRDNINCTVRDVNVVVDSTGKPTQTTAFALNTTAKVDIVLAYNLGNQTNSSIYPTSGISITGVQGQKVYTINQVTGLTPGDTWLLRCVAFQI